MLCNSTIEAWEKLHGGITFRKSESNGNQVRIPCGQCIACRVNKKHEWAVRIVHESMMHTENCFITLTYNDENQPENGSLCLRDFQLFMKKLRKKFPTKKIRFFHCGEYGPQKNRPHYHAVLFGMDFPDKTLWKSSRGMSLYRSSILEHLWTHGYSSIGSLTIQSARYVAGYVMKKFTGEFANQYKRFSPSTGEVVLLSTEYATMSRMPGLGKTFWQKYSQELIDANHAVIGGKKHPIPKYYLQQLKKQDPVTYAALGLKRRTAMLAIRAAQTRSYDDTSEAQLNNFNAKQRFTARSYEDK